MENIAPMFFRAIFKVKGVSAAQERTLTIDVCALSHESHSANLVNQL